VIVPRAWRANIDTKYGLVRQAGSELASFAAEWAEGQVISQIETDFATIFDYFITLAGDGRVDEVTWTPTQGWTTPPDLGDVYGRSDACKASVSNIVPVEKVPRNPFNGASYFALANDAGGAAGVTPGALAASGNMDGQFAYFALIFLGTDSTDIDEFHAGMSTALEGLRNGVFFARTSITAAAGP